MALPQLLTAVGIGYDVAQFARTRPDRQAPAFEVTATLREKEPASLSKLFTHLTLIWMGGVA